MRRVMRTMTLSEARALPFWRRPVALLTLIGTLISDLLLALLDPRIRFGGRDS